MVLVHSLENPEIRFDPGHTLQKRLAAFPNKHNTEWEACNMSETRIRIILIIYEYDKENDIVSAIVKFLLI